MTEELCRCHLCSGSITVPVSPGTAPRDSSFLLNALMVHHYQRGAWYPRGGASEIAFHTVPLIERAGGAVLVRAAVTRILVSPDGTAVGERPARGLRCGDGQQCGMGDSAGWVAVWDGWQCGMGGSEGWVAVTARCAAGVAVQKGGEEEEEVEIHARVVISDAGTFNTFGKLLPAPLRAHPGV